MSAREFKPGDVAMIRVGDESVRAIVGKDDCWHIGGHSYFESIRVGNDVLIKDPRPLVVIDPEDRQQAERLSVRFHNEFQGERRVIEGGYVDAMQAALREFANPKPRIEEPTGLGAVVEDEDGSLLIRNAPHGSRPWVTIHGATFEWADIDPVRVLSEGVTS